MKFNAIKIADVAGNEQCVDLSKQLGNYLYCYAHDEEISTTGRAIYNGEDVAITDALRDAIGKAVAGYPYIFRNAIMKLIE